MDKLRKYSPAIRRNAAHPRGPLGLWFPGRTFGVQPYLDTPRGDSHSGKDSPSYAVPGVKVPLFSEVFIQHFHQGKDFMAEIADF